MSYAVQGPELEGERGTVEVPHAPKSCPLCNSAVDVTSVAYGWLAPRSTSTITVPVTRSETSANG
jgi:hypothetical protein